MCSGKVKKCERMSEQKNHSERARKKDRERILYARIDTVARGLISFVLYIIAGRIFKKGTIFNSNMKDFFGREQCFL